MELTNLNIAAVVTNDKVKQECSIFIPSHGISTYGEDFIEALSIAISTLTAIYHYDREHGIPFPESVSLAEATSMCHGKKMFPSYVTLEV